LRAHFAAEEREVIRKEAMGEVKAEKD